MLSVKGGNLYIFLFSFCQLLVTNRTVYNINTALQETEKKKRAKGPSLDKHISDTPCSNRYKWSVYNGSMKSDYQRGPYYFMLKSFSYHVGDILVVVYKNLIKLAQEGIRHKVGLTS